MVKALIDKKSAIYSDRPSSYVSHDLITQGDHLLVMKNGEKWRLFRKLLHQKFNENRCEKEHITLQNAEAVQMLKDCLVEPEGLMRHPKRFSNSIIMSLGKLHLRRRRRKKYPARWQNGYRESKYLAFVPKRRKPDIWRSFMNWWKSGPR